MLWGARGESVGRNRIARSGQDSIGRVAGGALAVKKKKLGIDSEVVVS